MQKGKDLRRRNISVHVCEKLLLWHHRFVFVLTELEKQMKIENLFVTWQQRSAQSNMPISVSLTRFQELSKDIIKPQNDVNSKELFINTHLYLSCGKTYLSLMIEILSFATSSGGTHTHKPGMKVGWVEGA